ncbi:uncharacterized protein LOC109609473 [Aethina tumida]|uniref:uncharacterized protein LOC109609473 n=1 Tax=Aethina tumida TaxID=116153 RepID=UPI00096B4FB9|nr:uncharacterized protein LOC109609473 [Aethina tumida]
MVAIAGCCKCCDNMLTKVAKNKNCVLGIGILFLMSLTITFFATMTKDICYFGIKLRGPAYFVVWATLLLIVICVVVLLNSIMKESPKWILTMDIIILVLYVIHVIAMIVAAVTYASRERTQHELMDQSSKILTAFIFFLLEVTWFGFILIIYKYYRTTITVKEQPESFQEG